MTLHSDASHESDSKTKSFMLLRAALSKKALNPVLIRLIRLTPIADYFLILSGASAKHVQAVAEAVLMEAKSERMERFSAEGMQQGNWALLDYGDVIVHIFQPEVREFYDLEGLWSEAPREVFPEDILKEIEAAKLSSEDDYLDEFE